MSTLPFDDPPPVPPAADRRSDPQPAPQPPVRPKPADRHVWTVTALSAALRTLLETRFGDVWVEGELSNAKVWNTGHLYFTLKDGGSQLRGVMFRSAVRALKFRPEDGLQVIARGRISVYETKGEYQIVCEQMEPRGLGALQLAFEQLKKRLAAEGLFDAARKRPLPALPRRIGLVTSLDGAALRDMVRVLRRRHPNVHLVIAPTRVQGDGAGAEIARAIARLARVPGVDVLIVGRGGGSLEDLWAFNEEVVARAIAASHLPVISAVGHETDVTIADFVADLRAPTPSAAAELVVKRKDEFFAHLDRLTGRLQATLRQRLYRLAARVHALESRPGYAGLPGRFALRGRHVAELTGDLRVAASSAVARRRRRLDTTRRALELFDPRHRLATARLRLASSNSRLSAAVLRSTQAAQTRFRASAGRLNDLSPLSVLGRGYAMCWDGTRTHLLRDATGVRAGDPIRVTLAAGELAATVTHTRSQA